MARILIQTHKGSSEAADEGKKKKRWFPRFRRSKRKELKKLMKS